MNTEFLFDNIFLFPIIALIVIMTYLIQFCSAISPCNIRFNKDSHTQMRLMSRYNLMSDNAFTLYISATLAGTMVSMIMISKVVLILIILVQFIYIIPVVAVMLLMYEKNLSKVF